MITSTPAPRLDALPAAELRRMVRERIEQHLATPEVEALRATEDAEREMLEAFALEAGEKRT